MFEPFFIASREAVQCAVLLALVLCYPPIRESRINSRGLAAGVFIALLAGFPLGYIPFLSKNLPANETWTFWRYISEAILFYSCILFLVRKPNTARFASTAGVFVLGFFLFFFESRAVGFLVRDVGALQGKSAAALAMSLAGTIAGFSPLSLLRRLPDKLRFDKVFTLPSLLMTLGALQFGFGGVAELERENIMIPLRRGLLYLLGEGMKSVQSVFLLSGHPFLDVTAADVARFLAGERIALALTVVFMTAPPLFMLIRLFSRPDPVVSAIQVAAQRRRTLALFRGELLYQTAPVLTVFLVLVVMLHAVNVSLNPLYEPPPLPVRPSENAKVLSIPVSDKKGDFTDRKLRKYVYYYGNRQIVFIAVLRPDGNLGAALDECEICRPAEWNIDAKGYAQRGELLICKYCRTPVATSTVNNPGGCNPIPLPFKVEDDRIVISLEDLVALYNKVQDLEKKGTHL